MGANLADSAATSMVVLVHVRKIGGVSTRGVCSTLAAGSLGSRPKEANVLGPADARAPAFALGVVGFSVDAERALKVSG